MMTIHRIGSAPGSAIKGLAQVTHLILVMVMALVMASFVATSIESRM